MDLNEAKIAFIICTNDNQELQECLFYLNNLDVPEGYNVEIITVMDASSMASGYNEGMDSSDAKYKVYLHQDVFILNKNFLRDILAIFKEDTNIGMVGCIGCRKMPDNANAITAWNIGRILHNSIPNELVKFQDETKVTTEADAVDGCLIATQYDVPWREDIFDGWDFYDISQCYEFHRIGKKVVLPYQDVSWIYHDNSYSKMVSYDYYRKCFINEYREYNFQVGEEKMITEEYYDLREKVVKLVESLFYQGEMESVCAIFESPSNRGILALKEYELLSKIYLKEEVQDEKSLYFEWNMKKVIERLRKLKYLVKRIEFGVGEQEENINILLEQFSIHAIREMILAYCVEKDSVWERIQRI